MNRWRSVRVRLTLAVAFVTALTLAGVAILAPSAVEESLEDDLLTSEAESALALATIDLTGGADGGFIIDDLIGEGGLFDLGGFDLGGLDLSVLEDLGLGDLDVDDLDFDPDVFGDFIGLDAESIVRDQVLLLREVDRLDDLTDAAGGPFAITVDDATYAVIQPDGSVTVASGSISDIDVPVMPDFEVTELLFDDLALFQTESGAFIDVATEESVNLAIGVVPIDGIDLLVAADSSSVDRSVDRVRSLLWLAVPILTALVGAIAWLLASRSLRPVRSITAQASTISGGTLDARVPVPPSGDEIATLATTVNEMLDRLESDDRSRRQFISDASHELRSPVAVMRNEAEVALAHPDAADAGELASAVADESARMSRIIDDLLALARHDEGVPITESEVDLDDIVLADAQRARRIPVDTSAVSAGRVRGRPDELARLVGHLLDNAARHARSQVSVSLRTDGGIVVLHVDDDGPGVAPADRDRVFERFARLDEARTRDAGGAGLGLAVVAGIAERSGGTTFVTDSPLGGARFTVRFPN